jgi:hypothetical protein
MSKMRTVSCTIRASADNVAKALFVINGASTASEPGVMDASW